MVSSTVFVAVVSVLWAFQVSPLSAAGGWSYGDVELEEESPTGPHLWGIHYKDCNGFRQSPIDIPLEDVIYDPTLQYFNFSQYAKTTENHLKLKNYGGHTAKVLVSGPDVALGGGSLPGTYVLRQLHFHWGDSDETGSEHTVEGEPFPMEIHFVHQNTELEVSDPNGLAVVGFFFEIGAHNRQFDQLLNSIPKIINANEYEYLRPFPILDLLPVLHNHIDYFRYQGSLTTPPCFESVIWSLAKTTIAISEQQIELLRFLLTKDGTELINNFRPTQPLYGRQVLSTVAPAPHHEHDHN